MKQVTHGDFILVLVNKKLNADELGGMALDFQLVTDCARNLLATSWPMDADRIWKSREYDATCGGRGRCGLYKGCQVLANDIRCDEDVCSSRSPPPVVYIVVADANVPVQPGMDQRPQKISFRHFCLSASGNRALGCATSSIRNGQSLRSSLEEDLNRSKS